MHSTEGFDPSLALENFHLSLERYVSVLPNNEDLRNLQILIGNALQYNKSKEKIMPGPFAERLHNTRKSIILPLTASGHMITCSMLYIGNDLYLTMNNSGLRENFGVKTMLSFVRGNMRAIKIYRFKDFSEKDAEKLFTDLKEAQATDDLGRIESLISDHSKSKNVCTYEEGRQDIGNCTTEGCRRGARAMLMLRALRDKCSPEGVKFTRFRGNLSAKEKIKKIADVSFNVIDSLITEKLLEEAKGIVEKGVAGYDLTRVQQALDKKDRERSKEIDGISSKVKRTLSPEQEALKSVVEAHNQAATAKRAKLIVALNTYTTERSGWTWVWNRGRRDLKVRFANKLSVNLANKRMNIKFAIETAFINCSLITLESKESLLGGIFNNKLRDLLDGNNINILHLAVIEPAWNLHVETEKVEGWKSQLRVDETSPVADVDRAKRQEQLGVLEGKASEGEGSAPVAAAPTPVLAAESAPPKPESCHVFADASAFAGAMGEAGGRSSGSARDDLVKVPHP